MYFFQILLGLFGNIERIGRSVLYRLKLRLQPFKGKFRVSLASSGSNGGASHYQLVWSDDDGDVVQNMRKRLGPSGHDRLTFCFFITLCQKNGSGRLYFRHLGVKVLYQFRDTV